MSLAPYHGRRETSGSRLVSRRGWSRGEAGLPEKRGGGSRRASVHAQGGRRSTPVAQPVVNGRHLLPDTVPRIVASHPLSPALAEAEQLAPVESGRAAQGVQERLDAVLDPPTAGLALQAG